MDTKFQTSFIPKKPIMMDQNPNRHSVGTSIFMLIAVIIFIVSIAGAGSTFLIKSVLIKNQISYKTELDQTRQKFDTNLIDHLKKVNTKIDVSKKLLKNHISVSDIFYTLNSLTSDGIRFNSFEFTGPLANTQSTGNNVQVAPEVKIVAKGTGRSFSAIAWQSDVFGTSEKYGKNKVIKNPIISDLAIDQSGNVNFTFTGNMDPAEVSFEKSITSEQTESADQKTTDNKTNQTKP